jgi:hypothetical protein
VIDVSTVAFEIARDHPNSGMSLNEIAAHIETMGIIVGATLLLGNQLDRTVV